MTIVYVYKHMLFFPLRDYHFKFNYESDLQKYSTVCRANIVAFVFSQMTVHLTLEPM